MNRDYADIAKLIVAHLSGRDLEELAIRLNDYRYDDALAAAIWGEIATHGKLLPDTGDDECPE